MQRFTFRTVLTLVVVGAVLLPARAQVPQTLYYGGDLYDQLALRNCIDGNGDARIFDDFIVPAGDGWHVTSAWSCNAFNAGRRPRVTQANWSIRTGMAAGSGGDIVASGIGSVTMTPTGRWPVILFPLYDEYEVRVNDLSVDLAPGAYWLQVTPIGEEAFNSITLGANSVGASAATHGHSFFLRLSSGDNYTPETHDFSMGLAGYGRSTAIPEPGSQTLVAIGLLAAFGGTFIDGIRLERRRAPRASHSHSS